MRSIVLWLLNWLEQDLDTDLKERVTAYRLKVEAAEAEETRLLGEIELSRKRLLELTQTFTDNQRRRVELENAIAHANTEADLKKAELDRLSANARVRLGL